MSATQQRLSSMAGASGSGQQRSDPRMQRALEQMTRAAEDMRRANQSGQPNNAEAQRAAERLNDARNLLGGMRREDTSSQLGALSQRADQLAQQQRAFENELKQRFANGQGQNPQTGQPMGLSREQNNRLAEEKMRIMNEYQNLEKDLQSASRGMGGTQRAASNKLRQALGEVQQEELGLKMKFMSEWLRRGLGGYAWNREE